ncbi:MAG: DNA-processing protein DprA [Bryobacteraceae bacterium]
MTTAGIPASNLTADDELHWLALHMVRGLGDRKAVQLLERFRTPQLVFRSSRSELEAAGLAGSVAQTIASGCSFEEAVEQHERAKALGVAVIPVHDPRYPPLLREIYDPPLLLFARGRTEILQSPMIAIVGTRRPTPYGVAVADRFGRELAEAGLVVTSGMARGIDTSAHRGALASVGETIAVFGCGVDVIYPAENRKLADEISAKGLLLSEFPIGTPGHPQHFPIRNRIVSGMSLGVVVVEGAEYSGSAITARLAMDQGREVFAVPGNITSKMSFGPNLLIRQGATLVQKWSDITAELQVKDRQRLSDAVRKRMIEKGLLEPESFGPAQASLPLPGSQSPAAALAQQVLAHLQPEEAVDLDGLIESLAGTSSSELIAVLFDLEMEGLVRQLPGKRFARVWQD